MKQWFGRPHRRWHAVRRCLAFLLPLCLLLTASGFADGGEQYIVKERSVNAEEAAGSTVNATDTTTVELKAVSLPGADLVRHAERTVASDDDRREAWLIGMLTADYADVMEEDVAEDAEKLYDLARARACRQYEDVPDVETVLPVLSAGEIAAVTGPAIAMPVQVATMGGIYVTSPSGILYHPEYTRISYLGSTDYLGNPYENGEYAGNYVIAYKVETLSGLHSYKLLQKVHISGHKRRFEGTILLSGLTEKLGYPCDPVGMLTREQVYERGAALFREADAMFDLSEARSYSFTGYDRGLSDLYLMLRAGEAGGAPDAVPGAGGGTAYSAGAGTKDGTGFLSRILGRLRLLSSLFATPVHAASGSIVVSAGKNITGFFGIKSSSDVMTNIQYTNPSWGTSWMTNGMDHIKFTGSKAVYCLDLIKNFPSGKELDPFTFSDADELHAEELNNILTYILANGVRTKDGRAVNTRYRAGVTANDYFGDYQVTQIAVHMAMNDYGHGFYNPSANDYVDTKYDIVAKARLLYEDAVRNKDNRENGASKETAKTITMTGGAFAYNKKTGNYEAKVQVRATGYPAAEAAEVRKAVISKLKATGSAPGMLVVTAGNTAATWAKISVPKANMEGWYGSSFGTEKTIRLHTSYVGSGNANVVCRAYAASKRDLYQGMVLAEEEPSSFTVEDAEVVVVLEEEKAGLRVYKNGEVVTKAIYNQNTGESAFLTDRIHLAGGSFRLLDANGNPVAGTGTMAFTEDGVFIPELSAGTYTIEEMEAPDGYVVASGTQNVKVTAGSRMEAEVRNDRRGISLQIEKCDKSTKRPLSGAVFELRAAEEITEDGNLIYEPGDPVWRLVTGEDGSAKIEIPYLPFGTYVVRETTAPASYNLTSAEMLIRHARSLDLATMNGGKEGVSFRKDQNGNVTRTDFRMTFEDEKTPVVVKVIKSLDPRDPENETSRPLAGAVFSLYRSADGDTVGTDDDGISVSGRSYAAVKAGTPVSVSNPTGADGSTMLSWNSVDNTELLAGTYDLIETTAPDGYEINETVYHLSLMAERPFLQVEINDKAKEAPIRIIKKWVGLADEKEVPDDLSGISFRVYSTEDPGIQIQGSAMDFTKATPLAVRGLGRGDGSGDPTVITTGPDGTAETLAMPYGTYYVVEMTETADYKIMRMTNEDGNRVTMASYALPGLVNVHNDAGAEIVMTNMTTSVHKEPEPEPCYMRLIFRKYDPETRHWIHGEEGGVVASFRIKGPRINGVFNIDRVGPYDDAYLFLTNWDDGPLMADTDAGWYTITELSAPDGYVVAEPFTIWLGPVEGEQLKWWREHYNFDGYPFYGGPTLNYPYNIGSVVAGYFKDDYWIDLRDTGLFDGHYSGDCTYCLMTNYKITYVGESSGSGTYVTDIPNYKAYGSITATKKAEVLTGFADGKAVYETRNIPGVTLQLYDASTNQPVKEIGVTDANGQVTWTRLKPGKYYVKELSAPAGLLIAQEDTPVTVDFYGDAAAVTITDNRQHIVPKIYKRDAESGGALAGAEFTLFAREDVVNILGETIIKAGTELGKAVSGEDGMAIFDMDLPVASYVAKETRVPRGYSSANLTDVVFVSDFDPDLGTEQALVVTRGNVPFCGRLLVEKYGEQLVSAEDLGTENAAFHWEEQLLAGVTFDLMQGEERIDSGVTDAQGALAFEDLGIGTYTLIERSAPEGFLLAEPKTVVIAPGEASDVSVEIRETIWDEKQKMAFTLTKTDGTTGKPVAGAEFTVYAGTDIYSISGELLAAKGSPVAKTISGKDGSVTFRTHFPVGTYEVRETGTPKGYTTEDQKNFSFSATYAKDAKTGKAPAVIALTEKATNQEILGTLTVRKTGLQLVDFLKETTGGTFLWEELPLTGAGFSLYAAEEILSPDGSTVFFHAGDLVAAGETTGSKGDVTFENLHLGKYTLKETKVPHGYLPEAVSWPVEITAASQDKSIVLQGTSIRNTMQRMEIALIKKDGTTEKPLAGAGFTLYAGEDIRNFNGDVIVRAGDVVAAMVTGPEGKADVGMPLPVAAYRIRETGYPHGYSAVDVEDRMIRCTYDPEQPAVIRMAEELTNRPILGEISVIKTGPVLDDYADGKFIFREHALPGAEFALIAAEEIRAADGSGVIYAKGTTVRTGVTDEEGKLHFTDLPLGCYTVKEMKAPEGYLISEAEQTVLVDTDAHDVVKVSFTAAFRDKLQPVRISLRKTDDDTKKPLAGAEFSLIAGEDIHAFDGRVLVRKGAVIRKAVTDDQGSLAFGTTDADDLTWNLPHARYMLRETGVPTGYTTEGIADLPVNCSYDPVLAAVKKEVTAGNKPTVVEFSKQDITSGEEIPGAEITVTDKETGAVVDTWVSERGKNHVIKRLEPGKTYIMTEKTVPYGYLQAESIEFKVADTGAVQTVVMKDAAPTASLTVRKTGRIFSGLLRTGSSPVPELIYRDTGLGGVIFRVYAAEPIRRADGTGADYFQADALVAEIATNPDGIATITGLHPGKYYVEEYWTPPYFIPDPGRTYFDLSYRDAKTPIITDELAVMNIAKQIRISLHKVDAETKKTLAGAVFGLYAAEEMTGTVLNGYSDGKETYPAGTLLESGVTNREGYLEFKKILPPGYRYYVQEIAAPAGYVLSEERHEIAFPVAEEPVREVSLTIYNQKEVLEKPEFEPEPEREHPVEEPERQEEPEDATEPADEQMPEEPEILKPERPGRTIIVGEGPEETRTEVLEEEQEKPAGGSSNTGDSHAFWLLLLLCLLSAGALIWSGRRRRYGG